ncbi:MAG: glutaredoxin family protein [Candidatus Aenigmarchaeota archaeon]|nr:glutaredoxin family protein [Candidatus Aenigmarchaeota archaeon]
MKVIVYSTQTCPWCFRLKDWLKEREIEFEEKDVGEDQDAANELLLTTGQMGVPVTVIEKDGKETVVVGFDKEKLEEALK